MCVCFLEISYYFTSKLHKANPDNKTYNKTIKHYCSYLVIFSFNSGLDLNKISSRREKYFQYTNGWRHLTIIIDRSRVIPGLRISIRTNVSGYKWNKLKNGSAIHAVCNQDRISASVNSVRIKLLSKPFYPDADDIRR